jgi:hypothetical protein
MNATQARYAVIELESVERDYGMAGTIAIVESPEHGRLLIEDGFGGIDSLQGGSVRWKHGMAVKLQPGDTLESLRQIDPSFQYETSYYEAMKNCLDPSRPILPWEGYVIENVAKACGL